LKYNCNDTKLIEAVL